MSWIPHRETGLYGRRDRSHGKGPSLRCESIPMGSRRKTSSHLLVQQFSRLARAWKQRLFSVALTRAFKRLSARECDVRTEAQQLENLFHGKSSGLDTSTIAGDAAILFSNGEILQTFHPVAADIVVADSGPRDSCSTLVSRMMELRGSKPELWSSLANQISDLSHRCVEELSKSPEPRSSRESSATRRKFSNRSA